MKRKSYFLLFLIIILAGVAICVGMSLLSRYKEYQLLKQSHIANQYYIQNSVFMISHLPRDRYLSYDYVNETELYLALICYEQYSGIHIDINEIKEYLSSEYDESGELMINHVPSRIQDYIQWCMYWHRDEYGLGLVDRYIDSLQNFYIDHVYHTYTDLPFYVEELTIDQANVVIELESLSSNQLEQVIAANDGSEFGIDLSVFEVS